MQLRQKREPGGTHLIDILKIKDDVISRFCLIQDRIFDSLD